VKAIQENPLLSRLGTAVEGQEATVVAGLQMVGAKAIVASAGVARFLAGLLGWVVLPVYFSFFLIASPKGWSASRGAALPQA